MYVAIQIIQRGGGDGEHMAPHLVQNGSFYLLDEVWDVFVMAVKRAAREARAIRETGDGDARKVARRPDLPRERLAQQALGAETATVAFLFGHGLFRHWPSLA